VPLRPAYLTPDVCIVTSISSYMLGST
jgi:hypothetical protein